MKFCHKGYGVHVAGEVASDVKPMTEDILDEGSAVEQRD